MSSTITQKFNDDLLLLESDRRLAADRFPELAHVLDFPELRQLFAQHDALAKRAKLYGRVAGSLAIFFGIVALAVASVTPLFECSSCSRGAGSELKNLVGIVAAVLGVVSILIGGFGGLMRGTKQQWLCHRLMTERLRQFQFQALVCRTAEVLASTQDGDTREQFAKKRMLWFEEFQLTHEGHLAAKLRTVLDDDAEDDFVLLQNSGPSPSLDANDRILQQLYSAYRLLRLDHQLQYANYKLRTDESIFSSSAARQLAILRDTGLFLILAVFIAHLGLALWLGMPQSGPAPWVHVLIIWLVIGVLATRAIEEGLQPGREVERYVRYRSSLLSLRSRFDQASTSEERGRVMLETEHAVYQEMRGFMRTNSEARFVL